MKPKSNSHLISASFYLQEAEAKLHLAMLQAKGSEDIILLRKILSLYQETETIRKDTLNELNIVA